MAASTGVTLDSVTIEINSSVKSAEDNISSLTKTLSDLKTATKGGLGGLALIANNLKALKKSSTGVEETVSNLSKMSTLTSMLESLGNVSPMKKNVVNRINDLMTISQSIGTTADAFGEMPRLVDNLTLLSNVQPAKGLQNITKSLATLSTLAAGTTTRATEEIVNFADAITESIPSFEAFSQITEPKGFSTLVRALKGLSKTMGEIPKAFEEIDNAATLENIKRVATEVADALEPLSSAMEKIGAGYSAIGAFANKYGVSISSVEKRTRNLIDLNKLLSKTFNSIKNSAIGFGNRILNTYGKMINRTKTLNQEFKKTIITLLGGRSIFTILQKAAGEYRAFDKSLDKISQNAWRAFGAQLAPALEYVIHLLTQAVRVIYSVVKALFGVDLIARANAKAFASYQSSLKGVNKELGNLQKFDDLNVVDFPKDSGGDDFEPIVMDEIDLSPIQKVIDWMTKLKEAIIDAWKNGGWQDVGKVLAEGVNGGVDLILDHIDEVGIKFRKIAKDFADLINGFVTELDAVDIGKLFSESIINLASVITTFFNSVKWDIVGQKISDALTNIDLVGMINALSAAFESVITAFYKTLLNIDWAIIAKNVGDAIIQGLKNLKTIGSNIPWKELGKEFREALISIDWKGIWKAGIDALKEAKTDIEKFISGLTGISVDKLDSVANGFKLIAEVFVAYKLITLIQGFGDALAKAGGNPALMFAGAIVLLINGVKDLFKLFDGKDTNTIWDYVKAFGEIAGAIGLLVIAFKGLKDVKDATGVLGGAGKAVKGFGGDFTNAANAIGKGAEAFLILEGIKAVVDSFSNFLQTVSDTGMSAGDILTTLGAAMIVVAGGFAAIAASTKLINTEGLLGMVIIFGGLSLVLHELNGVLESMSKLGDNAALSMAGLAMILESLGIFLGVLIAGVFVLTATGGTGLVALLALVAGISAILLVMKATLPTILDALGDFIVKIGPTVNKWIQTIGDEINKIIFSLGTVLPPIINSVGDLFTKVFKGIEGVIKTVGKTIENIMKTSKNCIIDVLNSILRFINEIGPAVNNLVDNIISAVTKLINFMISGIEYLINNLIIGAINGLMKVARSNSIIKAVADVLGWNLNSVGQVSIPRFVPKLETGTNEIPYEGLYHLHPGEAVVPKKYNPALGGGSNDETNERLDRLITIMDNLSFTNVVNIGNEKLYEKQQSYNKRQENKYGTLSIY